MYEVVYESAARYSGVNRVQSESALSNSCKHEAPFEYAAGYESTYKVPPESVTGQCRISCVLSQTAIGYLNPKYEYIHMSLLHGFPRP